MVNLLILLPLLAAFVLQPASMTPSFGPDTDARRILICLYATIAILSLLALALLLAGRRDIAVQISVTLFAVQILYKLMTWPALGLSHGVVAVNLAVVLVHSLTLFSLWMTRQA